MTRPTAEDRMPRVMVLVYEDRLTHSVWVDFIHRKRTRKSLETELRQLVRKGEIVAWRLIYIEKEVMGNDAMANN